MATDGSAGGVTVLKQGWGIEPILQKQVSVHTRIPNTHLCVRFV
jgi:hypothetical protein